jgi:ADP-dependent NAD(P)H-hydrate dehydratase / NAD(P)H-hydrate epimerase
VVAAPTGETTLIPFANPALAVGGSGDVLSGVIVGLLAQGVAPYAAACLGAYLHGAVGGIYGKPSGLLMGELADLLPEVMERLRQ